MPRPRPWAVVPALTWAVLTGSSALALSNTYNVFDIDKPKTFLAQISPCPAECAGRPPVEWTVYSSLETLAACDQPMLFDLNIYTPLSDPSSTVLIRACTSTQDKQEKRENEKREDVACVSGASESRVSLQFSQESASSKHESNDLLVQALSEMKTYVDETGAAAGCGQEQTIMLSYYKGAVVGAFAGPALDKSTIPSMVDELLDYYKKSDLSAVNLLTQICGETRDLQHTAGLAVASAKDISYVRSAFLSWNEGKCTDKRSSKRDVSILSQDFVIRELALQVSPGVSANNMTIFNSTSTKQSPKISNSPSLLTERANPGYCPTQTVPPGGSCDGLAKACKISTADLFKYNNAGNGQDWCRKLQVGQKVCCGSGSLKPLPGADGTCNTYTIKAGDDCSRIGVEYSLTPQDVATFNDKTTWGWRGCQYLSVGMKICLSKGYPPAPAILGDATCGPQKPGTIINGIIKDAAILANVNPCPLNACCNIWGNCGVNAQFCTEAEGPTGNPGTSPPNVFGCISNCGMDIVNNKITPPQYQRVGYYEAFNWDRSCLHQRAEWANTLSYTHMHWAFADITKDFKVTVNDTRGQWEGFLSLSSSKTKRIVSFGGWGFSTDPATYQVLREAMFAENRDRFVANIVDFVKSHNLDGVDIDWEYPGAPDIPGIPIGLPDDAPNYLAFLRALRRALPFGYSLSIAAPASYWYLKPFLIREIGDIVDYIVYMTYDLHGQWDYGSKWAMDGCPAGNCLRSHVNQTEVMLALSMITKAGVPAMKIMVGESSYGRSFRMAQAGCTGPQCTFTGTNTRSDAAEGRCTNTGGYLSNAEIKEIIARSPGGVKTWYDDKSASDYLVYNNTEWVAYMNDKTKQARRDTWKGLNFLGTIDWATDLQEFGPSDVVGPVGDYNQSSCVNVFDGIIWNWDNPIIQAPAGCTNLLKPSPLSTKVTLTAYTTITIRSGNSISSTVVAKPFEVSEVGYQPFTFDTTDISKGVTVITYNPIPRITPEPTTIRLPAGWTPILDPIPQPGRPGGTSSPGPNPSPNPDPNPPATTTTTQDAGVGFLCPLRGNRLSVIQFHRIQRQRNRRLLSSQMIPRIPFHPLLPVDLTARMTTVLRALTARMIPAPVVETALDPTA
ncbi:Killer toxin subunits alpha/beta [Cladobotryum mycophilum]|uniref:chitinase n=1 Tax=Cladobotryum mycophilum TaxID=491253 RepID=A0ABR0STT3_9HYPO